MPQERRSRSRMSLSEVITIVIAFHGCGCRTFKDFYTLCVSPHWCNAFLHLVSYTRFVELMPWCLMLLCCFLNTRKGEVTGISFIDSTLIEVAILAVLMPTRDFLQQVGWGKAQWVGSTGSNYT